MKLAVLQAEAVVNDVAANLRAVLDAMARAVQQGADLLVTPELFLTGYAPRAVRTEADADEIGRARDHVARAARELGIAVVVSYPEAAAGDDWHIRASLIDPEGAVVLDYGKVHLFGTDEAASFVPAEQATQVVELLGVRMSIVICFDIEFPEMVRSAALAGAELILVPTAMSEGFAEVSEVLLRARALENHAVIAYSNHAGTEDGIRYDGRSAIAGPRGRDLARAGEHPELIVAEVEIDDVHRSHAEIPYLDQRRPDLYERWRRG